MFLWVSSLEATSNLSSFTLKPPVYANLLDNEGTLKLREEDLSLDCYQYQYPPIFKIHTREKSFRFANKFSTFDCIINEGDKKLLSKIYKYILTLKMAD